MFDLWVDGLEQESKSYESPGTATEQSCLHHRTLTFQQCHEGNQINILWSNICNTGLQGE